MKSMRAAPANIIEVVSPTRVAAPCRLEDTAMEIIIGTGEMRIFLQMARATGAII